MAAAAQRSRLLTPAKPKPTSSSISATTPPLPPPKLVCFSFAAYAKTLLDHLKSLNIPILPGLTDSEFTCIESTFHFTFPPDLRSILQEGLPVGPHFPNWRSSSLQQLQILLNLPSLNLSKNICLNNFWVDSWGHKPQDTKQALDIAKRFLDKAPVLVPIYRNCYIPSTPNVAGNPVFYVDDGEVRVFSFDVTTFFQQVDFLQMGFHCSFNKPLSLSGKKNASIINVPAWAATDARKIEFWTEVVERGRRVVARGETTPVWWNNVGRELDHLELRDCLEEVFWRLRDGGWREEEVREMMDGCDHGIREKDVFWHGRKWSIVLLRREEEATHFLDFEETKEDDDGNYGKTSVSPAGGKSFGEFLLQNSCSREDDGHQKSSIEHLTKLRSLQV
ncbi:unnamed protein product [Dovyalis caffra]|uniref:Uncharacterized protein n=1 Tax=Dovyalis caffra TaxID=77055 RepID=A0AAV1RV18_9ROSI|nr:unnamed protein product [Dovyalis caffra]